MKLLINFFYCKYKNSVQSGEKIFTFCPRNITKYSTKKKITISFLSFDAKILNPIDGNSIDMMGLAYRDKKIKCFILVNL